MKFVGLFVLITGTIMGSMMLYNGNESPAVVLLTSVGILCSVIAIGRLVVGDHPIAGHRAGK